MILFFKTFLDYWLQVYGVHKFGGGKKATNGTIIGMLLGLFFPPIGIILGPFIGAYIGARMDDSVQNPLKVALGALLGFLTGTILKLGISIYIIYIRENITQNIRCVSPFY